jgi:hypothetical protein
VREGNGGRIRIRRNEKKMKRGENTSPSHTTLMSRAEAKGRKVSKR